VVAFGCKWKLAWRAFFAQGLHVLKALQSERKAICKTLEIRS
jgi:hypothetical protein